MVRRVEVTENIYVRVYEDGHIELVGQNVTLDVKKGPYGRGSGAAWKYGENWYITPSPYEGSDIDPAGYEPGE